MGGPARARHEPEKARPDAARPYQARWPLRAVSGRAVVPTLRPRHDTKAFFSCRAGTTARLAHRAGAGPSGSAGPAPTLPCRQAALQQRLWWRPRRKRVPTDPTAAAREGEGDPDGGRCHGGRRRSPDRRPEGERGGRLARLRLALMAMTVGAAPPCAPGGDGGRTSRWKGRPGRRRGAGERKMWGSGRLAPGGSTGGGRRGDGVSGDWRIRFRAKDRKSIY
jgi:hypothetical protein